jgi:hypothetical protein
MALDKRSSTAYMFLSSYIQPGVRTPGWVYSLEKNLFQRGQRAGRQAAQATAATLVTVDAGHNVHQDEPAEFLAAVTGFLGV